MKNILLLIVSILLIASCSKKEKNIEETEVSTNQENLKIVPQKDQLTGNWWRSDYEKDTASIFLSFESENNLYIWNEKDKKPKEANAQYILTPNDQYITIIYKDGKEVKYQVTQLTNSKLSMFNTLDNSDVWNYKYKSKEF